MTLKIVKARSDQCLSFFEKLGKIFQDEAFYRSKLYECILPASLKSWQCLFILSNQVTAVFHLVFPSQGRTVLRTSRTLSLALRLVIFYHAGQLYIPASQRTLALQTNCPKDST